MDLKLGREGKNIAVVLAAGTGSRMKSGVAKQFIALDGRPLIYYSLRAMEDSRVIDECILVTGESDVARMREEVVDKFGFQKVTAVIPGGSERCFSVANAMRWIKDREDLAYVFIHDGARPFVTEEILERTYLAAKQCGASVAAMPSKDTVTISDEKGYAAQTPERKRVWAVQTPQTFEKKLITDAYARFEEAVKNAPQVTEKPLVTDDASVVEMFTDAKVKLTFGDYGNFKVTTPEDMIIAEAFLMRRGD